MVKNFKKQKKIAIIIPRSNFLISDRVMPPLGPLYIKSFLNENKITTDIIDNPDEISIEDFKKYDLIGYSTTTPQSSWVLEHSMKMKNYYPEIITVIGGAHAKYYFEDLIKEKHLDYIVSGEGEIALLKIIKGEEKRKLIITPKSDPSILNSFPIPWRDRSFLGNYHYFIKERRATTAITGRYCPMTCKFCEARKTGLILYSPDKIEKEILDIKNNCGLNAIMFYDDIFAINLKRVKELCEIIKPHNIYFRCFAHAKSFSEEMARILYDAGCKIICWGVESGNQAILDNIDKKTKIEENYRMAEIILKSGMEAVAFCMIGLPGETNESIKDTENFIKYFSKNKNFSFDLTIFYPYKKTYIYDHLEKFDLKINDYGTSGFYKGKQGSSECCVSTSTLNQEDIITAKNKICSTYGRNFTGSKANIETAK